MRPPRPGRRAGAAGLFAGHPAATRSRRRRWRALLAAASLAGAACYLVHLSSAGSVEQVRLARRRGPARRLRRGLHAPPAARRHPLRRRRRRALPGLPAAAGPQSTSRPCGRGWPTGRSTPSGPTTARSSPPPAGPPGGGRPAATRYGLAGRRAPAAAAAVRGGGAGPAHRAGGAARGGEPGARLRALPGQGCARAGIRRRHRDLRSRWRRRHAGRRVRRRHRRQRLRGPGQPRPDPGGAAARAADRLRRRARPTAAGLAATCRPRVAPPRCAGQCALLSPESGDHGAEEGQPT